MADYKLRYNEEFKNVLRSTGSTLMFSVYQAGKILLVNVSDDDRMIITPISYKKPMGLAVNDKQLAITTFDELHVYANSPELAKKIQVKDRDYKNLYFPRQTYHCGPLDLHDLCFVDKEVWAVNTRFSCICSFDASYNFTPRWKPHFISDLTPEDKCHLNGLALENGQPSLVSALGNGDTKQSWRNNITSGGILMSIEDNEIIIDGLAMPHSPRIIGDYIYLLESAKGELVRINRSTMDKETVVKLNGLVRGLAISGNTAFIGISKVREKSSTFSKLDENVKAEYASVFAIDIDSGMILGRIEFAGIVEEIYDIQMIPETNKVGILGLYDDRHRMGISTPDDVFWRKVKKSEDSVKE